MTNPNILPEFSNVGLEFLETELALANTFLDVAGITRSSRLKAQSLEGAEKAYRTVLRLLPRLALASERRVQIEQRSAQLEKRLRGAGRLGSDPRQPPAPEQQVRP